jgi:CubicO group peptidase (beta-lactamase class C family)
MSCADTAGRGGGRRRHRALAAALLALGLAAGHARAEPKLSSPRFAAVGRIVAREIGEGHIPGAVIVIGKPGGIVYRRAFGARALLPQREPMTADTIFDLASLTKVVATTIAIMQLAEAGRLSLSDKVAAYWPAFGANGKEAITVEQLLSHTSGLRPDIDPGANWSGVRGALQRIVEERPISPPGARFHYSDLNFIVLGELVRRISGQPLDEYGERHIFIPLGMADTGFNPEPRLRPRIAPTDMPDGTLRRGQVQDPTAYRMGGVAGDAGLFSTGGDLARFAEMLLGGGARAGVRILGAAAVACMTAPRTLPGGIVRGLGWDIASPYDGGMNAAFGPDSYGHTGYTGTSLWLDPVSKTYLVILTSRLHPHDRGNVKALRRLVADAVAERLSPAADRRERIAFRPGSPRRTPCGAISERLPAQAHRGG